MGCMETTRIINATSNLTAADQENILAIIARRQVGKGLIGRKGSMLRYSVTRDGEWFDGMVVGQERAPSGRTVMRHEAFSFQTR